MTLVVEDGSGLSTANSLAALSFALDYWSVRTPSPLWAAAASGQQETWLVEATDYVERRYRFSGVKATYAQALSFPRTGLSERDGQDVPPNVVPPRVAQAVAFLAGTIACGWDATPILERGGDISSESVAGIITNAYAPSALNEDAVVYVDGLLFPYLSAAGVQDTSTARRMQVPTHAATIFGAPHVPPEFKPGAFTDRSGPIPP